MKRIIAILIVLYRFLIRPGEIETDEEWDHRQF